MLEFAERIIGAYESKGLITGFIYGKYADGKTSYLLHTAMEVFKKLCNLSSVDAWFMALDHLHFQPIEAMLHIEAHQSKHPDERIVMLGMDDVGQHIPRARWWREDVVQFREWMTVARSDVAAVVFTAPTMLSLPGGIVDSCFFRIHVKRHPDKRNMSIAEAYEVSISPYFQVNVSGPIWKDEFPKFYPDFVFKEYEQMRKKMVAPLRRYLIQLMGEEEAIKSLSDMGTTHRAIGEVFNKERSTITKRLNNMGSEGREVSHS